MFCPYCGNPCAETHKFCFRCGNALPEQPAAESFCEETVPAVMAAEEVTTTAIAEEVSETLPEALEPPELTVPDDSEPEQEITDIPLDSPAVPPPLPKKGRLWPPLLFLAIMICVGLVVFLGHGGDPFGSESCFTVDNGTLYFDYSRYTGPDELTVPATVNGLAVTAISDGCFADCDRLTTIILPESVTGIGKNAFSGCDALRGIYIPNGVKSIGSGALSGCTALEAVYFPASTAEIGTKCLDGCTALHFVFYDGTYNQWLELYDGTYPSGMELHTTDGVYYAQP